MTGPPRFRRRLVHLLVVAGASLLAAPGCDGGSRSLPAQTAYEPVVLPLAERLAAADVQASAEHVAFLGDPGRDLFRAGWHAASVRDEDGRRWSHQRVGTIDVPLVSPAPLTLELQVTPVQQLLRNVDDAEPQRLRILWNGETLADRELAAEGESLTLRVPPERQRIGSNQLDLLPNTWLTPRVHRLSWDNRMLGVRLDALEVRSELPQVAPIRPLARRQDQSIVLA